MHSSYTSRNRTLRLFTVHRLRRWGNGPQATTETAHGTAALFIINQDRLILQKDLGKATTEIAAAMPEFDPAAGCRQTIDRYPPIFQRIVISC